MKVGDEVEWISQSGGYEKTKRGEIEAVVPAFVSPDNCIPKGFRCSNSFGMRRDHESYLVRVFGKNAEGRTTYGSKKLYWPRVTHLKVVGEGNGLGLCMEIKSLKRQIAALQAENAQLRERSGPQVDLVSRHHCGEALDNNR